MGESGVQGLPDHAHKPTLEVLPRELPVVANSAAAKVVQGLGYTNVTVVEHGQTVTVADGRMKVTAVEGALPSLEAVAPPRCAKLSLQRVQPGVGQHGDGARQLGVTDK